ncbi:MAG: FAD-binding oxidoreductase [Actinomycetota bacterium]|nr:FAD-binding oxidoreductase [Actinomycetota bacterium]
MTTTVGGATPADPAAAPVAGLVASLRAIVGDAHVLVDADMRATYETDWLGQWHGTTPCVVRPGTAEQVAAVLQACAAAGIAVVPQGGNTGLVGGSVPRGGAVLLSLQRFTELGPVDTLAMQVTAGAGVTIEQLQQHARAADLDFAVDWGARASATVGGAVNTNAGGSRVVRFGTMRAQVAGVQAVLADGSVITQLHGLPKETAGPHLPSLLVGSEGTLAVVTAARLRLVPWFRSSAAALIACDSLVDAVALLPQLRHLPSLDAVELLMPEALALACAHLAVRPPIEPASAGAFVMVDCAAHLDPTDELAELLQLQRGVLAVGAQRDLLYRIRDHVTIAIGARGVPLKLDVAVPVQHLDRLLRAVRQGLRTQAPAAELIVFGHLAEGNVHVNILGAGDAEPRMRDLVLTAAIDLGGTISAEHGIGVAKADWLERLKGPAAVAALRAIKQALDPGNLLNPGVLYPPG